MSSKPDCPRCGKSDKVDIAKYNKSLQRVTWFCSRCRITWKTGGYVIG